MNEEKNKRKLIGSRAKQRRLELGLSLEYVAEKLDVNKSTIQRYEKGSIDNSKKLVLEGLAKALSVSPEWLLGESESFTSDITDSKDMKIRDVFQQILDEFPLDISSEESDFAKDVLLLLLSSYKSFTHTFTNACRSYSQETNFESIAKEIGFSSNSEFCNVLFTREITNTINDLYETSEVLRQYSKDPTIASTRIKNLLSFYSGK